MSSSIPSVKVLVPKYVSTKAICSAQMACIGFMTTIVLIIIEHPEYATYAAIGTFVISLLLVGMSIWFTSVEREETSLIRRHRE